MEKFPTNTILVIILILLSGYLIEKVIAPSLTWREPIQGIDYPIEVEFSAFTKELAIVRVRVIMFGDARDISDVTNTTKSMVVDHFINDTMFFDTLGHNIMKQFDDVHSVYIY